jgi:flagellar biosynthetic protein FliP
MNGWVRTFWAAVIVLLGVLCTGIGAAHGQLVGPVPGPRLSPVANPAMELLSPGVWPRAAEPEPDLDLFNPASILAGAARALPGGTPGSGERGGAGGLSTAINILIVLTVLSLVPTIMLMCTCFLRIVIVLGLLKQALGTAQMPPGQVLLGLAIILTLLVMSPTIDRINREAIQPWRQGQVTSYQELWERARQPMRDFMFAQIEATGNWSSLYMVLNYRGVDTSDPSRLTRADVDMIALVPAFVLSELKTAFLMGFRVYLPFLVIDMVISSLLISMSMMMLPPVLISLPFKLLLFVLVDGWQLVVGSLISSFATHAGAGEAAPEPVASAIGAAAELGAYAVAEGAAWWVAVGPVWCAGPCGGLA